MVHMGPPMAPPSGPMAGNGMGPMGRMGPMGAMGPMPAAGRGPPVTYNGPAMPGDPLAGATCVVPMWNKQEFLCQDVDVPEETLEDVNGVKRKTMHDGSSCTTMCPRARWWQVSTQETLTCKDGRWRDDTGRVAEELVCDTSNVFYFTTLLVIIILALLCTPGGRRSFRQATASPAPAGAAGAEAKKEVHIAVLPISTGSKFSGRLVWGFSWAHAYGAYGPLGPQTRPGFPFENPPSCVHGRCPE